MMTSLLIAILYIRNPLTRRQMLLSPLPRGERGIDVTRGNSWSHQEGRNSNKTKQNRIEHTFLTCAGWPETPSRQQHQLTSFFRSCSSQDLYFLARLNKNVALDRRHHKRRKATIQERHNKDTTRRLTKFSVLSVEPVLFLVFSSFYSKTKIVC
jgi:hypothetical protein